MVFDGQIIAFIGLGNMAEAIVRGLLSSKLIAPEQIVGADPSIERRKYMKTVYDIETIEENRFAVQGAHIVVLCVKPQYFPMLRADMQWTIRDQNPLVVSIMAGVKIDTIRQQLNATAIARSMPNTPAMIGEGMTVWSVTREVSEQQYEQAEAIFSALGQQIAVPDEKFLDMATAVSGSGPGYVFLILEAMIDAGVQMGFPRSVAEQLVLQTVIGSAKYAQESGTHVAQLRNQVTSPGGTTAAGLYAMEKGGLRTVLADGILAAYKRANELGAK